ncbi:MAG: DUF262 domain-containing protein [Chloroflexota bacterium]|nr:DUF262 domain-containing protein [Chloroflexota bacterium]
MTDQRRWRGNRQTLSWFVDLYRRELLELDPPYQRRSVWNQRYREDFIETIILGYPAPSIFLFEDIGDDGSSRYSVVDGKQRLTTIISFCNDEFPTRDEADAHIPESERGKYFRDLAPEARRAFWSYEFTVEYLPSTDEALLNEVFDRINRNVAKLTRQELRHARFTGVFATAIEAIEHDMRDLFDRNFPRIVESSRRQMKDVEFAANLALLVERGPESTSQDDLDRIYADRDEDWEPADEILEALHQDLTFVRQLLDATPDLAGTRIRNQGDFYALVGAIDQLRQAEELPQNVAAAAQRVYDFAVRVGAEGEEPGERDETVQEYYEAARSAANDPRQRQTRIRILKAQLAPPA